MPTYEYECKICGHNFETIQSMADDPLKECIECGGEVRRIIGGGMGIIFKGSGFYVNDSRSDSSRNKGDSGKNGDGGSNGNNGSKESSKATDSSAKSDSSTTSSSDTQSSGGKPKPKAKS